MARKWLLALLSAVSLSACAGSIPDQQVPTTFFTPQTEQPAYQQITALVPVKNAETLRLQQLLDKRLLELTEDRLSLHFRHSHDPVEDFKEGKGDLLFLDPMEETDFSPALSFLSAPMLYQNHVHMSMSLNGVKLLDSLLDPLQSE